MFTGNGFTRVLPSCAVVLLLAFICIVESREMSSYYGPLPKPDPGQPYSKYYWVKSAMQKLQTGCPSKRGTSGESTLEDGTEAGTETTSLVAIGSTPNMYQPLGMENRDIPNNHITASSYHSAFFTYPPYAARLNVYAAPWCAGRNDDTPWIQVDFGDNVTISGLITKGYVGGSHYFVKTYTVAYNDGQSWSDVTSQDGTPQQFTGNSDGVNIVTVKFDEALFARYIRIRPTSWNIMNDSANCCMYFEVLG